MNPYIGIESEQVWLKGRHWGMSFSKKGMSIDREQGHRGVYIGEIIDSGEVGHLWSRMAYGIECIGETAIKLSVVALNTLTGHLGGQYFDLEQLIEQKDSDNEKLLSILESLEPHIFDNATDVLLYDNQGRYLIYWFECVAEGDSDRISWIKIYYEKFSWLNYLPQIYSEESPFLEKFLAVFQTFHEDLESCIDYLYRIYQPEYTRSEFLEVLNEWLPIDGFEYWNESQRRYLLKHYQSFNSKRGTKQGIIDYVNLYTHHQAMLIEHQEYTGLTDSNYHRQLYEKLYVDHPYGFTLLVHADALRDRRQLKALSTIVRSIVPAQVTFKIARLNPNMVLDDYVYLGVNTTLYNQTEIKLDEQSLLSMGIIGCDDERG